MKLQNMKALLSWLATSILAGIAGAVVSFYLWQRLLGPDSAIQFLLLVAALWLAYETALLRKETVAGNADAQQFEKDRLRPHLRITVTLNSNDSIEALKVTNVSENLGTVGVGFVYDQQQENFRKTQVVRNNLQPGHTMTALLGEDRYDLSGLMPAIRKMISDIDSDYLRSVLASILLAENASEIIAYIIHDTKRNAYAWFRFAQPDATGPHYKSSPYAGQPIPLKRDRSNALTF